MLREIQITFDGSTTIFMPEMKEGYHSKFGAVQESLHVYIKNGLDLFQNQSIAVLEMGLGTGLNVLTTFLNYKQNNLKIDYTGVDAFPVALDEALQMNYCEKLNALESAAIFEKVHSSNWEEKIEIAPDFTLIKSQLFFEEVHFENQFDLIYYDAFGFDSQPDVWTKNIFELMHTSLKSKGVLVTYACRTTIKNDLINLGFFVEKLNGAPGKREMLRATKN